MYIAKEDENGDFIIYIPQDIEDINGNTVTILNKIETYSIATLQSNLTDLQVKMDDIQAKLDAITACQGGQDIKTQFSNITVKKVQAQ